MRPRRHRVWLCCALAGTIALAATAAAAQSAGGDAPDDLNGAGPSGTGPNGTGQGQHQHRRGQPGDQHTAALPQINAGPDPWPRLDPGAVVCASEAALGLHIAAQIARLDRKPANEPADCAVVQARIPIAIVSREAPGRTEIRLPDPPGATGWTDAFLPEKSGSP